MRRIDPNPELLNMVSLLDLQTGDVMIDAQAEPDLLLRFAHDRTGDFGRCIGVCFGKDGAAKISRQLEKWNLRGVEMTLGSPVMGLKLNSNFARAAILRSTHMLLGLEKPLSELERVCKPGGRVLARHTQWETVLPKATEREQEMLQSLQSRCLHSGPEFFARFERLPVKGWREVRFDVYTVAARDPRAAVRHDYDWRTMMREQLGKARVFSPREILDLITRLEEARGAKVSVDRYLALGIKR